MDNSGNEDCGFLDAESEDDVMAKLKDRGLFVTNISLIAPEVTPEWSAISLASPSSIPSGRLLAQGLPCTHENRGFRVKGLLNLLGVDGELHLVFDRMDGVETVLELPIQAISQVQQQGLFRKRLVITTTTIEEHVFRGSAGEIQRLCEWGIFATQRITEGPNEP